MNNPLVIFYLFFTVCRGICDSVSNCIICTFNGCNGSFHALHMIGFNFSFTINWVFGSSASSKSSGTSPELEGSISMSELSVSSVESDSPLFSIFSEESFFISASLLGAVSSLPLQATNTTDINKAVTPIINFLFITLPPLRNDMFIFDLYTSYVYLNLNFSSNDSYQYRPINFLHTYNNCICKHECLK